MVAIKSIYFIRGYSITTWTRRGGKRGSVVSPRLAKGWISCKMLPIVHSKGGGGQNWVKLGPRKKGQFQTKSIISKTDFSSFSTYTYNIQEGNKHDYVVMLSSYILGNLALFDRVGVTATLYKNTCLCGWVGTAQADR